MFTLWGYNIKVGKIIRDPIYHFIEIPEELLPFVDNKFVQRLRWINQLPLEQLVYPSAQHSRFEHSLGTMHLAMRAAISLINNSEKKIKEVFDKDKNFKNLVLKEKKRAFILSAGIVGLLHDIGHAPFSHTLETASELSGGSFSYNHEIYGFKIVKFLFEEKKDVVGKNIGNIVLSVLNKKIKLEELSPVGIIIRNLIDSSLDADKGDYLLRDSYHCGVNYGVYDHERLWRNIVITSDYTLGVNKKGALEAWRLMLARYFMYKNVYYHHTRNITDAMLIDIIVKASKNNNFKIPSVLNEKGRAEFLSWRDSDFLKHLEKFKSEEIKETIERFMERKLYKKSFTIKLPHYPFLVDKEEEVITEIEKIKIEFEGKNVSFIFIILNDKNIIPPIFERNVQEEVRVQINDKESVSLADFLGFSFEEEVVEQSLKNYSKSIHFFIQKTDKNMEDTIKKKVEERLKKLNEKFKDK